MSELFGSLMSFNVGNLRLLEASCLAWDIKLGNDTPRDNFYFEHCQMHRGSMMFMLVLVNMVYVIFSEP